MQTEMILTGSRYFATEHSASDFDYFVEDSPGLRQRLESVGFVCVAEAIANSTCRAVYRRGDCEIQLVRDAEVKLKIQDAFKRCGFATLLKNKKLAVALWRFAYLCVRIGREQGNRVTG